MIQQEKSTGNLNGGGPHNIGNTILPAAKSKTVRSYTNNNQSLESIMKRANEIIKKSKNNSFLGGRPDITDILHPLTDSFVTLTTADSLQKNSQSTNREGCKVSPFVTASSPETTESKQSNPHSSDKSSKAKSKLPLGNQEDSANLSQRISIAKQLHNNYISEADSIFDNFDSIFKVIFNPLQKEQTNNNNNNVHTNNFAQKQQQNQPPSHQSFSANARDTDDTCRISLTQTFERVFREEKSKQAAKPSIVQQNQPQGTPQQQVSNHSNPIHIRAHSSIVNTNDNSSQSSYYMVPKQIQQTISSFQAKNQQAQQSQQQQQQQQQVSIQQQQQLQMQQQQNQQQNKNHSFTIQQQSYLKETNEQPSQQIQIAQQANQIVQGEIEQYLKKPQPAKIKTQSGAPLHPHPPLPQSTKMNLNGYNTNHFNAQRFRYRNSLRDKENVAEAANTSIGQLNTSNGQIMTNANKNNSFLNTPVASNHSNIPQQKQYQSIQPQQYQQQQQPSIQNQHSHQRSSSNIIDFSQNINNQQNNNNNSNSLQNSVGFYRPSFDSSQGPSNVNMNNQNNINSNNGISERLNTIGIDHNIKNSGYASLKERGSLNNGNHLNESLNYSSMRVNTSYNGSSNNNNNNNGNTSSSRAGSFQLNIPMSKMVAGKNSTATSLLNCLIGGQKVQQPQPTNNTLNNTNQNSNNTSMNQMTYNPTNNSTASLGNRSTSVPRANVGYLLQKKFN